MKPLSPLAAQIFPMLTAPVTVPAILATFADETTGEEIEAALDELESARLVKCDEDGAGVPYFYRRDLAAEQKAAAKWNAAQKAAQRARESHIAHAERAYIVAMNAADKERDAADPMAAIKAAAVKVSA